MTIRRTLVLWALLAAVGIFLVAPVTSLIVPIVLTSQADSILFYVCPLIGLGLLIYGGGNFVVVAVNASRSKR